VRHNGARHQPGSVLSLSEAEAKRLVDLGVATRVEEPKAPPPPPPPPSPSETSPELIVGLGVRDAGEALKQVQDPEVVRQVLEFERAKEAPRSTLIEAAERR